MMFTDRYHARPITSPRQAKHCLSHVLNTRKHAAEWLLRTAWQRHGPLDPNAVPGPAG
jgi:hypothetical protein